MSTRKFERTNKLAGGYIWLRTYADLSEEESKAEGENDEVPFGTDVVLESWLCEYITEDFGDEDDALERWLEEYTYEDMAQLECAAIRDGAIAFQHRDGYDGSYEFYGPLDKDAVLALMDYVSGCLNENGFAEASKYLDTAFSL